MSYCLSQESLSPEQQFSELFCYKNFRSIRRVSDNCTDIVGGRARAEPNGTRAETTFRLSLKRRSPFKSAGESVQSNAGSRGVGISVSNAGYTTFRGRVRVLATHCIRQVPLHFPSRASPRTITFRTQYNKQRVRNMRWCLRIHKMLWNSINRCLSFYRDRWAQGDDRLSLYFLKKYSIHTVGLGWRSG